jgi:predicted nuclease of restriction endonuclease-like RecB superfamily
MLTKDLLRVSRAGGGYHPQFADGADEALAGRVIGVYQGHVGEPRADLEEALEAIEREATEFKLVRGFAKLVDREATFETRAAVDPERARRRAFRAAESVGVVTAAERETALAHTASDLDVTPADVEESLYADREGRQILADLEVPYAPADLVAQYNLSLAQTALFDATEVRIRSSDPKALVSMVKRLRLMYEIEARDGRREVIVTGPDALFQSTRRYGTRFARLLRSVAKAREWRLEATIDDRGTEREMVLTDADPVGVPDAEPVAEVSFDSGVEADFAARFESLDLDWDLSREPEPLEAGARVMIPDFAFDYVPASLASGGSSDSSDGAYADFRVFFEIVGFWTPEYVEKKLETLRRVEGVDMIVAVDDSLGIGEEIAARDHRVIPYSGTVRLKDVRDALRAYEDDLVADAAAGLPEEIVPDREVVSLSELAADYGVSMDAIETKAFPEHELVGRTLVRPAVLDELDGRIEPGMRLADAKEVLEEYGITDASAVLSELGLRVEWEGLGGGTVRPAGG